MTREPMASLDAEREATVRVQIEEAWSDIERALDESDMIDMEVAAPSPEPRVPVVPAAPERIVTVAVVAAPSPRGSRRWQTWTLATAMLVAFVLVALHFIAGAR
jgi:hypothetical protein